MFPCLSLLAAALLSTAAPAFAQAIPLKLESSVYKLSIRAGTPQALAAAETKTEADRLLQQGIQQYDTSQFREAFQSWEQALQIYRQLGDRQGEASSLGNLGLAYKLLGQYEKAIDFYQQLLAIKRKLGDRQGEANALGNLGIAYYSLGQYEEAIVFYQQLLAIARELGDRQREANALGNLGNAYDALGQHGKAIDFQQQQLTIARELGDRQGEANALGNLGVAYQALGQYDRAIDFQRQSLTITRELNNRESEAISLSNLGVAYQALGQYDRAIDFQRQSLTIARELGDQRGEANALGNLGLAYFLSGQHERAIVLLPQVLYTFRELGDRQGEANALGNLGLGYYSLGQYEKAIDSQQKYLTIARELGDRQGEANALGNLGIVYYSLGQYEKAIDFYQQGLTIAQEIGDREGAGRILSNIGILLEKQNQPELGILFLKQSVNVRESIRGDIRKLSQDIQQSYTETIASTYRRLADLLLQQNRILEAQRVLDLLKVQELDDYLQDVQRNGKTEPGVDYWQPEQRILELYKTASADAAELIALQEKAKSTPLNPAEQARFAALNDRQGEQLDSFYQFVDRPEIQTAIAQLRDTSQSQAIELEQLQALQDNLRNLNQAVLLYPLILENRLELVLVTPNSPPIRRPVKVSATELNRLIVAMGQALKDPHSDVKPAAQQLYQYLIVPIEADLQAAGAKTILYAPDGALRYIPLAALYDGQSWLTQRFAVTNITAASLTDFDSQPSYRQQTLKVLAAACVQCNFNFTLGQRSFSFDNLTHAGTEVANLAALLPGSETRLDQAFNSDIVALMRQFPIVHLATHAAFVQGQPEESFIVLGNGERMNTRDIRRWNITNADLVVLSACETAVGEAQLGSGIEILGFGYQMQQAGAKSAIASLWAVSDGGTQILMDAFYAALQQGMTKTEALRQAQIALITGDLTAVGSPRGNATITAISTATGLPATVSDSLDHPYYWSPFILIGNGM